jgi:hypothetical protein
MNLCKTFWSRDSANVGLDEQFLYSMERLSTNKHLALLTKVNNA